MMKKRYSVSGFFTGVGGIELGFDQTKKFDIICSNEIDSFASKTFKLNFDSKLIIKDIRELNESEINDADIYLAGFPCQAFSVAGYQKGFEDDRGTLFFDLLRFIIEHLPRVVFLENVKNLFHHDNGNTFKVIKDSLEYYGYYIHSKVLNSKDYGNIPQNRERVYIVAFRNIKDFENFRFPEKTPLTSQIKDILFDKYDSKYVYIKDRYEFMKNIDLSELKSDSVYQWRRRYLRENKSNVFPTLTANMGTGGHNVPLVYQDNNLRKLTPRECFRVQGFPDDFRLPDIADAHLYKQAGNSVVVPVIKRLAESVYSALYLTDNS